jgi:hypothetical protein
MLSYNLLSLESEIVDGWLNWNKYSNRHRKIEIMPRSKRDTASHAVDILVENFGGGFHRSMLKSCHAELMALRTRRRGSFQIEINIPGMSAAAETLTPRTHEKKKAGGWFSSRFLLENLSNPFLQVCLLCEPEHLNIFLKSQFSKCC